MSYEILGVGAGVLGIFAMMTEDSSHPYLAGAFVLLACGISAYVGA